jgi:hypothetical protein
MYVFILREREEENKIELVGLSVGLWEVREEKRNVRE